MNMAIWDHKPVEQLLQEVGWDKYRGGYSQFNESSILRIHRDHLREIHSIDVAKFCLFLSEDLVIGLPDAIQNDKLDNPAFDFPTVQMVSVSELVRLSLEAMNE